MARSKVKESNPISFRLDANLVKRLDDYATKSMIPKTRIVEQALREYLDAKSGKED